jgi:hypothetical protein
MGQGNVGTRERGDEGTWGQGNEGTRNRGTACQDGTGIQEEFTASFYIRENLLRMRADRHKAEATPEN